MQSFLQFQDFIYMLESCDLGIIPFNFKSLSLLLARLANQAQKLHPGCLLVTLVYLLGITYVDLKMIER